MLQLGVPPVQVQVREIQQFLNRGLTPRPCSKFSQGNSKARQEASSNAQFQNQTDRMMVKAVKLVSVGRRVGDQAGPWEHRMMVQSLLLRLVLQTFESVEAHTT